MDNRFFERPILNSPYEYPQRHWELDGQGQPTQQIIAKRRRAEDGPLHLIVEIMGYRREDAKEKKSTFENYWVPGVNNLKQHGLWAFAEFTEVSQIEADFEARVESEFNKMIEGIVG